MFTTFPSASNFTRGDSAIQTAQRILPLVFLLIFGMLSNGYLMSKFGFYKPWQDPNHTPNAAFYTRPCLDSALDVFVYTGFAAVQANLDPEDSTYGVILMTSGLSEALPHIDKKTLFSIVSWTSGSFTSNMNLRDLVLALKAIMEAPQMGFTQVYYVAAAVAFVLGILLKTAQWRKTCTAAAGGA
ncbi:HC-toxin efflux carrier TOXA [Tolypocladium capitatum]|uniref:HC-toxin efflux carrier TOXA n=1 Tax=Tolypocladium capitatum TaxID=45235 RepID=A0A2K3QIV1_9HYPO|nr:HC-toxin efflux carrier TOXA [Tolypocladium capitatum]